MSKLSGMTGFGRAEGASGAWAWTIEARSVNGRSLEVRPKTPQGFDALDRAIRDEAQKRFQRGQVGVNVQLRQAEGEVTVSINQPVLEAYLAKARALVDQGASAPSADGLLMLKGVLDAADTADEGRAAAEPLMVRDLAFALDGLNAARLDEGARLQPVLDGFLDRVATLTSTARAEADAQTAVIRERFAKRVEELTDGAVGLEDRIFQEAAMMAARADVREELDRLDAHTASARALIDEGGPVGRRLDFLTQEFMREANTLCSKAATLALTSAGLDLKAVIEQFREQVQNVE
jgi:uncharacterized protein (TIGR00255 family)